MLINNSLCIFIFVPKDCYRTNIIKQCFCLFVCLFFVVVVVIVCMCFFFIMVSTSANHHAVIIESRIDVYGLRGDNKQTTNRESGQDLSPVICQDSMA
jgi:hypothetical protein